MSSRRIASSATRSMSLTAWFADVMRGRRGFWAWIGGFLALYLALQAVFFGLTVAAAAVPSTAVLSSLATAAAEGRWNAVDFPSDGIGHVTPRHAFAGVSDSYTECIAMTAGVSADVDDQLDPVTRSLSWPHLGTCSNAYPAIQSLIAGENADQGYYYNRYWIGSAVISRPLLVLGGLGAVRVAAAAIFLVGLITASVAFARRTSWWIPTLLFVPLLLSTNIVTQTLDSYPHVLAMGVGLLGAALGVRLGREPAPAIVAFALIAGGTFNFVDFLLNPPVAWSLFVAGVIVGRLARDRWSVSLRSVGAALGAGTVGWMLGYLLTWATRWLLAVVAFGQSALDEIVGSIFIRLSGENGALVIPGITMPTRRNVSFWIDTIPTAPMVATIFGAATVVALVILLLSRRWQALLLVVAVAAPALLVPIWYETLSNHSQIHMWFTYRAVPVALGIVAAAAWLPIVVRASARRSSLPHDPSRGEGSPESAPTVDAGTELSRSS